MLMRVFLFLGLVAILAAPANSLCIYNGVDNAKTTIQQEFKDSRWVVRARVISAEDGVVAHGKPDAGMYWTTYQLAVVRAYKGHPGHRIKFFTERDSGGFYMDRRWEPLPKAHDTGGEYLLFLIRYPHYRGSPKMATRATFVNYSCGQSKPWSEVNMRSRRLLEALVRRR